MQNENNQSKEQSMAERNKILLIRSGSHLFGTNTEKSDQDFIGVFVADEDYYFGLSTVEEVDCSNQIKDESGRNLPEAVDFKWYEFKKYIRLLADNNPNILATLFVKPENIVYCNDLGRMILDNWKLFPHKGLYHRFIGYAHSQKHKMVMKGDKYNECLAAVEYLKSLPPRSIIVELKPKNLEFFVFKEQHVGVGDMNIPINSTIKKAIDLIEDRLVQFGNRKELISKHGYDVKFAANLIQLLKQGIELLQTGRIEYPLMYRELILDIKAGKWPVKEVLDLADILTKDIEPIYKSSTLQYTCDRKAVNELARVIIKNALNTHLNVRIINENCHG